MTELMTDVTRGERRAAGLAGAGQPRVAVLGCGAWGRNLVRQFHRLGALVALSDPDAERAAGFAREYQVPAGPLEAVLENPDVDAVAIAAPAALHAGLCLRALDAGKDVFVEKPLALTVADGVAVREHAAATGRIVMVGHLLQYHPAFRRLADLVAAGALGRLQYIHAARANLGRIRREENVLWSLAPHDLSMILALAGDLPERVEATASCVLHPTIADVATAQLSFASGLRAQVFASWLHPQKEQRLVVVGDRGMVVLDDCRPWSEKLVLYPHRVGWRDGRPEPERAGAQPVALEETEPLAAECRHFLDCLRDRAQPRTDAAEGLGVLRVLEGLDRAGSSAAPVTLAAGSNGGAAPDIAVHESSYVDGGCEIGTGTRIWHFSHVLAGSRLGRDCTVGQNVMIGPNVTIGDGCKIQNNVSLYDGVTLEDGVFCGPSCVFTNVLNPRAEVARKSEFRPTRVGRGATIGANATIVCGVQLGAYSFVAAGAVVTRDVPPHALVAGVPARRIGWMSHDGERLGPSLVCPRSARRYVERDAATLVEVGADASEVVSLQTKAVVNG